MPKEIRVQIVITAGAMKGALAAGLLTALALPLVPETLTMTTYYPAPVGVYNKMTTTSKTVLARDNGSVGVGTASPENSAIIDLKSVTRGFLQPRMSTTQRDNPASPIGNPVEGLTIYNTTTKQVEFYDGTSWRPMGGGAQMTSYSGGCPSGAGTSYGSGVASCNGQTFTNNGGKNRLVSVTTSLGCSSAVSAYVNGVRVSLGYSVAVLVPPNGTYSMANPGCSGPNFATWTEWDF